MPWDITLELKNRPGTLAELGEAAGQKGINIEGLCGFPCEGVGVIHVLVDDATEARNAFDGAGFAVTDERQVLVVDIEDRPGAMGALTRRLANAGVNVDLLYLATNTRAVIAVDDLDATRGAL
jgi:hypothetical protein